MIIKRFLQDNIEQLLKFNEQEYQNQPDWLKKRRAIIIYGARQVGKTTLVKNISRLYPEQSQYINCEKHTHKEMLESLDTSKFKRMIGDSKLLILDEAQMITNIGTTLKLIVDTLPDVQVIATGSSSFELANKISEPMTGRVDRFVLYPLSYEEVSSSYDYTERPTINNFLRFGAYPQVFIRSLIDETRTRELLDEVASNYLYKDMLLLEEIKRPDIILKLLQALALQVGSEVSSNELATLLSASRETVERYLYMLEQSFVIFSLHAFSKNPRKELAKKRKFYFYDLGIRNSLIQNYNTIDLRNDAGGLFENFCIMERLKYNQTHKRLVNKYFWRNYKQKEVDYIEEHSGKLEGYEFKWGASKKRFIPPKAFFEEYENASVTRIDRANFEEFITSNE